MIFGNVLPSSSTAPGKKGKCTTKSHEDLTYLHARDIFTQRHGEILPGKNLSHLQKNGFDSPLIHESTQLGPEFFFHYLFLLPGRFQTGLLGNFQSEYRYLILQLFLAPLRFLMEIQEEGPAFPCHDQGQEHYGRMGFLRIYGHIPSIQKFLQLLESG